jgi:hypothetical protein
VYLCGEAFDGGLSGQEITIKSLTTEDTEEKQRKHRGNLESEAGSFV